MDVALGHAWADVLTTGIVAADARLRIQWANPALAELLGVGTRGVVGQPLAALLDHAAADAARRVLAEQRTIQVRNTALTPPAGAAVDVDVTLQAVPPGLLLEIHPLAVSLPGGSPLAGTLRGFAHEVKNPLSGMRGAAQLLRRRVADDELRALADVVIEEADRLGALADRLLHHAGPACLAPVNLHEVLERVVTLARAAPGAPDFRCDYDPSAPDVTADADRLQQILVNLVRNAAEAGARTVSLRTRVEHGARVGERVLRSALRVDVMDDGTGVPAELRASLFEPLVTGRPGGTGLGLALARELAREHGGELRHAGGAGATVFSLYLPLERHGG